MPPLNLFPPDHIIGVFRGFSQGGLEFHANLVLPYRNEFQNIPMHGQFLLVQLETPFEGVLGCWIAPLSFSVYARRPFHSASTLFASLRLRGLQSYHRARTVI